LVDIHEANVVNLAPTWMFQTGVIGKIEATPLLVDGTLYVSGPWGHAWALDGATGKEIWHYQHDLPDDVRTCCGPANRGMAHRGEMVYLATLDAQLVALDRQTGQIAWSAVLADYRHGYSATAAPLVVENKIIVGVSTGGFAARGFIDAFDATTGDKVWRVWTVPAPGEVGADTWTGESWKYGGGGAWVTGTYDPAMRVVFWGTGNPNPLFNGSTRRGDNLYTNSLLAIDVDSGKLRWHYQFTPHDEHDWDSAHVPVLVGDQAGRQPPRVVVANRNGLLYVLERNTGRLILGKPYIHVTWTSGVDARGRPVEVPGQRPTPEGSLACPGAQGGTNFMSPAFDPKQGLLYVMARETCMTYFSRPSEETPVPGMSMLGGTARIEGKPRGALKALDISTGELRWEHRLSSPSWSGVLATAGGIVVSGDAGGQLFALDAKSGQTLWSFNLGGQIWSSPMTARVGDRQLLIASAGSTVVAFALRRP
jgi:alcohol dehydrogenase (cytochrome c)